MQRVGSTRKIVRRKIRCEVLDEVDRKMNLLGGGSGLVIMSSASTKILSRVVTREKELQSRGHTAFANAPPAERGVSRNGGMGLSASAGGLLPAGNRILHGSASAPVLTAAINPMQLGWEYQAGAMERSFERVQVRPREKSVPQQLTRKQRHEQRLQRELDAALRGESPPSTADSVQSSSTESVDFRQHLRSRGGVQRSRIKLKRPPKQQKSARRGGDVSDRPVNATEVKAANTKNRLWNELSIDREEETRPTDDEEWAFLTDLKRQQEEEGEEEDASDDLESIMEGLRSHSLHVKEQQGPQRVSVEQMSDYALKHSEEARSIAQAEKFFQNSVRLRTFMNSQRNSGAHSKLLRWPSHTDNARTTVAEIIPEPYREKMPLEQAQSLFPDGKIPSMAEFNATRKRIKRQMKQQLNEEEDGEVVQKDSRLFLETAKNFNLESESHSTAILRHLNAANRGNTADVLTSVPFVYQDSAQNSRTATPVIATGDTARRLLSSAQRSALELKPYRSPTKAHPLRGRRSADSSRGTSAGGIYLPRSRQPMSAGSDVSEAGVEPPLSPSAVLKQRRAVNAIRPHTFDPASRYTTDSSDGGASIASPQSDAHKHAYPLTHASGLNAIRRDRRARKKAEGRPSTGPSVRFNAQPSALAHVLSKEHATALNVLPSFLPPSARREQRRLDEAAKVLQAQRSARDLRWRPDPAMFDSNPLADVLTLQLSELSGAKESKHGGGVGRLSTTKTWRSPRGTLYSCHDPSRRKVLSRWRDDSDADFYLKSQQLQRKPKWEA